MSTTQAGYTPLVTAATYGKCDVVVELLDNGADINSQTNVSHINTFCIHNFHSQLFYVSIVTFGI